VLTTQKEITYRKKKKRLFGLEKGSHNEKERESLISKRRQKLEQD